MDFLLSSKTESTKSRGLRGNVGYMGAWVVRVTCLRGLRGYVGQNIYVGHHFTRVIFLRGTNFFAWVQNFLRGSFRRSKFFAWVQQFLLGSTFGGGSKKKS